MVNNNYSFLTVVLVALVVAVVVSLITASITGNVIKVQEKKKGTEVYTKEEVDKMFSNIKANSCNADDVCEVTNLSVSGNAYMGGLDVNGLASMNGMYTNYAEIYRNLTVHRGVTFLVFKDTTLGFAYVCVNSNGTLFKSSTPCV